MGIIFAVSGTIWPGSVNVVGNVRDKWIRSRSNFQ
jgi:hypothetical protein